MSHVLRGESLPEIIDIVLGRASEAAKDFSTATWVIVPDRFTLQAEELLLKKTPVLLNTRVLTFSMLYNILVEEITEKPLVLTKTSGVLFMWRAVRAVKDKMVWFAKSANSYSFAERMFNTINQLTSSMVDFEALVTAAVDPITKKKMQDIVLVYNEYKKLTAEFTDASGMLGFLIDNIERSKLVRGTKIFVVGFDHLTVQRGAVLERLGKHAKEFMLGVRAGSELDGEKSQQETKMPVGRGFSNSTDEAHFIANEINLLVQNGAQYKDVTVAVCAEEAIPVFKTVFEKCKIPFNCDLNKTLAEFPVARLFKDWLLLCQHASVKNILAVARSQFCTIEREELFHLENKLLEEGIRAGVPELEFTLPKDDISVAALNDVLETIGGIMQESLSTSEFIHMFQSIATAVTVSTIPTFADRVMLGLTKDFQPSSVPHLFVAGINDGNFPVAQSDTDIITQFDVNNLKVDIDPSPILQTLRNVQFAENVIASGKRTLQLTGSDSHFPASQVQPLDFYCKQVAKREMKKAISNDDVLKGQKVWGSLNVLCKEKPQKKFVPEKVARDRFSVTELEAFYSCPFQHYLRYVLGIEKRKLYGIHTNMVGNILHDFLEKFLDGVTIEEVLKREKFSVFVNNPVNKPIIANLKKHAKLVAKQIRQIIDEGQFKPISTEQKMECGGIVGKVDRIDAAGKHAIILDYKSGATSFSYKDVYMGAKLQLPLYLSFLQGKIPAGAFYVPIKPSAISEGLTYIGMVTKEGAEMLPEGSFKKGHVVSDEQLSSVMQYSNTLAREAVQHIRDSVILKSPSSDAVCRYCVYSQLCDSKQKVRGKAVPSRMVVSDISRVISQAVRKEDYAHSCKHSDLHAFQVQGATFAPETGKSECSLSSAKGLFCAPLGIGGREGDDD